MPVAVAGSRHAAPTGSNRCCSTTGSGRYYSTSAPPAAAAPCPRRQSPQLLPAPHLAPPPLLTAFTSEGRVEGEGEEKRDLGGEEVDAEARSAAGERGGGGERGRPPVTCPRMRRRQP
ncbi:unnamed protein product [Urochloa humidicola]